MLLLALGGWYFGMERPRQQKEAQRQADLARLEAQSRAASDAKEKARLEAEAERLRTEREKQQAAEKAKAEAEQRERERRANAKGGLLLKTAPSGATVTLGGEEVQTSPATFKGVKTGKYPLRVSLEGYEAASREVEIKENEFTDLGTITLAHSTGSLQLSSAPEGADYEARGLDNELRRGTTPALVTNLPTGEYSVTMRRGDWEQSGKVSVRRNETASGKLEFAYGSVSLKSEPSGAAVWSGGKELGTTPLTLAEVRPGEVSYTLKLTKHKEAAGSGKVEAKQELALVVKLEKTPYPTLDGPYENSLGMKFAPVAGTEVLFGVWDVRVKDFRAFAQDRAGGWEYQKGSQPVILKSDGEKQRGWEYGWSNPGFEQSGEHPVVCVSWEDAQAFCGWLTRKEQAEGRIGAGQSYRLPTDAEWSVAVGLPTESGASPKEKDRKIKDVYPWGSGWPPPAGAGNYAGSEARDGNWPANFRTIGDYRDGYARTSPVGSFKSNGYGLYDMGGNVWQWCEDWYDTDQKYRVLRGSSWGGGYSDYLLSSSRLNLTPDFRIGNIGFRCVLVAGSSP